jgi:hypothetical protein
MEEKDLQHMVIGHSQIRNLEDYHFPDTPDINFHIDVKSYSGGHAPQLAKIIKDEIYSASKPLRISAIIWQNSNWNTTLSEVEDIVMDMEDFLKDYPFHSVAFPECLFVPQQEKIWDKIARINTILGNYNKRQGFDRYPLHKIALQVSKNTKALNVRQCSYREFNKALTAPGGKKDHNGNNLGYHIDEGAPKRRYAQHIRKFHKFGFNDHKPRPINQLPPKRISKTVYFAGNPVNKMKNPKVVDARIVINKIKQNSGKGSANLKVEDDHELPVHEVGDKSKDLEGNEEEDEVQIIEPAVQDTVKKVALGKWLDQGKENGYLKAIQELIASKQDEAKNMKRKKEETESSSSIKQDEAKNMKRKKEETESSSSSDSESSSSSESESSSSDSDTSSSYDSDIPNKIKKVEKYLLKMKRKMKERKKKEKKDKERKKKEKKKQEKKKQEQKKQEKKKQEQKKKGEPSDHGEKKVKKK